MTDEEKAGKMAEAGCNRCRHFEPDAEGSTFGRCGDFTKIIYPRRGDDSGQSKPLTNHGMTCENFEDEDGLRKPGC